LIWIIKDAKNEGRAHASFQNPDKMNSSKNKKYLLLLVVFSQSNFSKSSELVTQHKTMTKPLRKFKFDENLQGFGKRLRNRLEKQGVSLFSIKTTKEQGLNGKNDEVVRREVLEHKEVIITCDRDFIEMYKDVVTIRLGAGWERMPNLPEKVEFLEHVFLTQGEMLVNLTGKWYLDYDGKTSVWKEL
jgi:predicted nuclease of predicted toxin-antitoxin system